MKSTVIKVNDLSKIYPLYKHPMDRLKELIHPVRKKFHQDFYALRNISLEVVKGEVLGIVGKNGSGKSTLLKIITGVSTPTSGSVEVNGKISALIELGAGFNPEYTGIENIYLNGTILGYSKNFIDLKLDEILSFANIGDYVYQPVKTYSSGMLVRLAFSVAITVDPDILIVDEALSVGDALFQRKCFSKINSFIENGKTVLFVSHSLNTVAQLCNRTVLMDTGAIILDAHPKLVRNLYCKLLYSPVEEYHKTREEIIGINQDEELKTNLGKEQPIENQSADALGSVDIEAITDKNNLENDFYINDFISTSIVQTKIHDVDIYDIHLKNLKGETVNFITMNEQYIFSHKVKFNVAATKVNFDLVIRTITGVTLCRTLAPGKYPFQYIEQVKAGDEFLVDWHFKCHLLTGTYCTNILVWGIVNNQERGFLNRIVDALLFKVQDVPNSKYEGLVHLEQNTEITKI